VAVRILPLPTWLARLVARIGIRDSDSTLRDPREQQSNERSTDRHRSDGTRDKNKSRFKDSSRKFEGITEELKGYVYTIGTNDQADVFMRTTEAMWV